ncbi:Molybdopterin-synthase adenylyltransferase [Stieleria maiorica]|uniref:Molybdopterin-synthase adenylyltransferase n=1 Tax=Stieleria maiorica TaxID=2795974 RepID=A0A5B9MKH1_9BACT|nr:ThiF family adenylyltransferase [Stieleria maiorica]QEG00145.1 Molybdopterin-synthase adenylyltransferase [Stieleria maiorica]
MSGPADRFTRQSGLVPRERLAGRRVTVIGVGAVGRQVAMQLASIGVPRLQLIDFDQIELTNVTTQGYRHDQIGQPKVGATACDLRLVDLSIDVTVVKDRFRPRQDRGEIVISCVDSISSRAAIWRCVKSRCDLWIDGRMRGEVVRVLASDDPKHDEHYETTLFAAAEAHTGSCTTASTVYAASLAASLMVHQLARWLRGITVERDLSVNLLASEMMPT